MEDFSYKFNTGHFNLSSTFITTQTPHPTPHMHINTLIQAYAVFGIHRRKPRISVSHLSWGEEHSYKLNSLPCWFVIGYLHPPEKDKPANAPTNRAILWMHLPTSKRIGMFREKSFFCIAGEKITIADLPTAYRFYV